VNGGLWGTFRIAAVCAALALGASAAASDHDSDLRRATDVVASHPAFADLLAVEPGWSARGYDARDRYGLWRIDLVAADGRPLGWAQVHLERGELLSWETTGELGEGAAYQHARARLLDVLRRDARFRAIAGDVDDHDWVWIGREDWRDTWIVHIERGPDSLVVILRSEHAWTRSLDDLSIVQIVAPAVVSVDEWRERHGAEAIALAFADPGVAAAVRGVEGWTADAEPLEADRWRVRFLAEGRVLAEAEVDVSAPSAR
jgi:hypothetical protein